MSREPTDRELGRLLGGRPGPSVLDKEAVFEAVMQQTTPKRRRPWTVFAWPLAAATAVALGVFAIPKGPPVSEFAPRGGVSENVAFRCVRGAEPAPCARGATLLFDVTSGDKPYFAAFGRRADGAVIWYLPAPGAVTAEAQGLSKAGFALDEAHVGRIEVYGLFTDRPMTREALKTALGDTLEPTEDVSVVRRTLDVAHEASP